MKHQVLDVNDAANISFVVSQTAFIEPKVLAKKYPQITYARDIPVSTAANPFSTSVTFYSTDEVGAAKLISGRGDDIPMANITLAKHDTSVSMAAIGYSFSLEEVGQAQMLNMPLDSMGANAARMSYERFVDAVAYTGNTQMGVQGLYNTTGITTVAAAGLWAGLTVAQILADVNTLLSGAWSSSLGIEMPNVLKLPLAVFAQLASTQLPNTSQTVLDYILRANVYTASTGQTLQIGADFRLTNRAVAYTKDPDALVLHVPMALRFLPVQTDGLDYVVPGMFRLAGLDVRRKGALRYMDGVA